MENMEGRTSEKSHRNLHCTKGVVKKESVQNQEANRGEKAEQETRKGGESWLGDRAIKHILKCE